MRPAPQNATSGQDGGGNMQQPNVFDLRFSEIGRIGVGGTTGKPVFFNGASVAATSEKVRCCILLPRSSASVEF